MPFATAEEARRYALTVAKNARGMFAMLKEELYCAGTLTLTCETGPKAAEVVADELFFLTRATGVLPIGGGLSLIHI